MLLSLGPDHELHADAVLDDNVRHLPADNHLELAAVNEVHMVQDRVGTKEHRSGLLHAESLYSSVNDYVAPFSGQCGALVHIDVVFLDTFYESLIRVIVDLRLNLLQTLL